MAALAAISATAISVDNSTSVRSTGVSMTGQTPTSEGCSECRPLGASPATRGLVGLLPDGLDRDLADRARHGDGLALTRLDGDVACRHGRHPRGGNGSFPGATVSEARICPSLPCVTSSPPRLLPRIRRATACASACVLVCALARWAPGALTFQPPLGSGTTCRRSGVAIPGSLSVNQPAV
ncbi:hypothetical protein REQ_34500 [Prescottella equi 103S]|uniref:Uncharacterized protein n=1 Tax=Rhodococcus hoagii (strain 103S) TaxID=685727 RepID=A0A3S5YAB3_RHOH1|nr:hypothetical protein REQ_34500 [Prescottella equi 103S]